MQFPAWPHSGAIRLMQWHYSNSRYNWEANPSELQQHCQISSCVCSLKPLNTDIIVHTWDECTVFIALLWHKYGRTSSHFRFLCPEIIMLISPTESAVISHLNLLKSTLKWQNVVKMQTLQTNIHFSIYLKVVTVLIYIFGDVIKYIIYPKNTIHLWINDKSKAMVELKLRFQQ